MSDIPETTEPATAEPAWYWRLRSRIEVWAVRLRRKLPYLVWHGDEVDVRVLLYAQKLPRGDDTPEEITAALDAFFSGGDSGLAEIEQRLNAAGITFDKGLGHEGRDWEWDYSLAGPISVRFKGCAERPERRRERPRPKLVSVDGKTAA